MAWDLSVKACIRVRKGGGGHPLIGARDVGRNEKGGEGRDERVLVPAVGPGVGGAEGAEVGAGIGCGEGARTGCCEGAEVGASVRACVGAVVGVAPMQYPDLHTSLSVSESLSSQGVPSALEEHLPVAGSQVPLGNMQNKFGDAEHPTVKQSPMEISSRARSPV